MFSLLFSLLLVSVANSQNFFYANSSYCTSQIAVNKAAQCVLTPALTNDSRYVSACNALMDCMSAQCSTFNENYFTTNFVAWASIISTASYASPPAYGCDASIQSVATAVGACACALSDLNITGIGTDVSYNNVFDPYCTDFTGTCSGSTYNFAVASTEVSTLMTFVANNATWIDNFTDTQAAAWTLTAFRANSLSILDNQFAWTTPVRNNTYGSNPTITTTITVTVPVSSQTAVEGYFDTDLAAAIATYFTGGNVTFGARTSVNVTNTTGTGGGGGADGAAEFGVVTTLACVMASIAFFL